MTRILSPATLVLLGLCSIASTFTISPILRSHALISTSQPSSSFLTATAFEDLTKAEQTVYSLVEDLHKSQYPFRIVVIGNGAILETTSKLGPVMKLNKSPKTGEALLTLASDDQSFEFHLMTSQVSKVALTEKEAGDKIMRIIRFLNSVGDPMCSLILGEDSEEAKMWYATLRTDYGHEVQL